MRSIIPATFVLAVALATGCAATVASDGYGPDLVTVSPGVQVIADYDEPIFYSDGYYWRQYGGGWYRSSYYTGGWVYAQPPVAVMRIDRPYAYRHYRPAGWQGRPRGYAAQPVGGGWRGNAAPPPHRGWHGNAAAAPPPSGGWRGNGPPAAAGRPTYAAPLRAGPPPATRPGPQARPAPAPA